MAPSADRAPSDIAQPADTGGPPPPSTSALDAGDAPVGWRGLPSSAGGRWHGAGGLEATERRIRRPGRAGARPPCLRHVPIRPKPPCAAVDPLAAVAHEVEAVASKLGSVASATATAVSNKARQKNGRGA